MLSGDLEGYAPWWPSAYCQRTRQQRVAAIWLRPEAVLGIGSYGFSTACGAFVHGRPNGIAPENDREPRRFGPKCDKLQAGSVLFGRASP